MVGHACMNRSRVCGRNVSHGVRGKYVHINHWGKWKRHAEKNIYALKSGRKSTVCAESWVLGAGRSVSSSGRLNPRSSTGLMYEKVTLSSMDMGLGLSLRGLSPPSPSSSYGLDARRESETRLCLTFLMKSMMLSQTPLTTGAVPRLVPVHQPPAVNYWTVLNSSLWGNKAGVSPLCVLDLVPRTLLTCCRGEKIFATGSRSILGAIREYPGPDSRPPLRHVWADPRRLGQRSRQAA